MAINDNPLMSDEMAETHGAGLKGRALRRSCLAVALMAAPTVGHADKAVSCGGAAMAGGAELLCSHVQSTAPAQFCTYSWTLMTTAGSLSTVQGSFMLAPGASNQAVYQGYGFNSALSNPIVLCQGRKG